MGNLILVTNWEKVEDDSFYLTDKWIENGDKEAIEKARELQKESSLYEAYIVDAKNYAIYSQMDADQVFIDSDDNIILHCESAVINNNHEHRIEADY